MFDATRSAIPWIVLVVLAGCVLASPLAAEEPAVAPHRAEKLPHAQELIVGSWVDFGAVDAWRYVFTPDGRFDGKGLDRATGRVTHLYGTYEVVDQTTVRMVWEALGGKVTNEELGFFYRDAMQLETKETMLRLFREGADHSPGAPPGLAGSWVTRGEGPFLRMQYARDGSMLHEQEKDGKIVRTTGRYRVFGKTLSQYLEQLQPQNFPFALTNEARTLVCGAGTPHEVALQREGPPVPTVSEPAPQGVVGTWVVVDDEVSIEVVLRADGTFTNMMSQADAREVVTGTYEFGAGQLVVQPKGDAELRFKARLLDANRLQLVEEDGEVTVLARKGAREEAPEPTDPAARSARLAGTWLMRTEGLEIRVVLGADGRYTETMRKGAETETTRGRYEIRGDKFVAHPDGEEPVELKFRFIDDDTIELLDEEGNGARLNRQP